MNDAETLEQLYNRKFDGATSGWMPAALRQQLGHFNVFRLDPKLVGAASPRKRDYFKVALVRGNCRVHYRDQSVEIQKTVSEIAYALDFIEGTYFNSFFKKHLHHSPGEFRHV